MKKCPTCDGDGFIIGEIEYDHDDMPLYDIEDCPTCKGEGFILSVGEKEYGEAMMPDKGK